MTRSPSLCALPLCLGVVVLVLLCAPLEVRGGVARLINYQGVLTDAGGAPLSGPHDLAFRLYPDSVAPAPVLWLEAHVGVPVEEGLFQLLLGEGAAIPDSVIGREALWLGVTVGTDAELAPRRRVGSVLWAMRAGLADSAAVAAASPHEHDERYFTEAELSLPGTINDPANPLEWTKLKNVPAGFADGVDDVGAGGGGGWVDDGGVVRLETSGDQVGIGTEAPEAKLDVRGTFHVGAAGEGHDVRLHGPGNTLCYWHPARAAFRAGVNTNGVSWVPDSLGNYSFAAGAGSQAKGVASFAGGWKARATNYYATAFGYETVADGWYTSAFGKQSRASGQMAFAAGDNVRASGGSSFAVGARATASGSSSVAMGQYVTAGPAANTMALGKGINVATPLVNDTANSLVVAFGDTTPALFVGGVGHRVGIGTGAPAEKLDVAGTVRAEGVKIPTGAAAERVLTSDAAGNATWQELPANADWVVAGEDLYAAVSGNVGIGTATPSRKLEVDGGVAVSDTLEVLGLKVTGSAAAGHVLTCADAQGQARWQEPPEFQLTFPYEGGCEPWFADTSALKITNFSLYNAIAIKGQTGGTLTGNYGVAGEHLGGQTRGYLGGRDEAVRGVHAPSGTYGCLGMASQGAFGRSPTAGTRGYLGGFVGAYGEGPAGDFGYLGGYLGGSDDGARGHHAASANYGSIGRADCGIYGRHAASGNDGTIANHTEGVLGVAAATGNHGKLGCSTAGVHGRQGLLGPHGYLGGTHGAYGEHPDSSTWGALGAADGGVVGRSDYVAPAVLGQNSVFDTRGSLGDIDGGAVGRSALSTGVLGPSSNAVRGEHASGSFGHIVVGPLSPSGPAGITVRGPMGSHVTTGALGHQEAGVLGEKSPRFYGALARLVWDDDQDVWQYGVFGYDDELLRDRSYTWAGGFSGDVYVLGWLSKWGGYFLIDHPLDPANKLLRHSFVESPENLLIYRGRARLDASGEAAIALPEYFAALTREDEATVGLSCVGASFLTGYEWESDYGSFRVFGDPGREVSWAVYADRDDPVIRRLARPVEEEKGRERGYCDRGELLNPTAYGYPESAGWAHKLRRDERSPAAPSPEHIHGE